MTKELQRNQMSMPTWKEKMPGRKWQKQVAHEIKNPLTPMKLAVQQLMVSYRDKNKNLILF